MSNTSTSSRMKELKDLKDADAQRSQNIIPPFIQQPLSPAMNYSRLTNVNPLILVFDGPLSNQCTKTLNIANISNDRIAWRVLCNAPTRYVVSPNKGFLFKQEKAAVQVILLSGAKYHRRHAFVVQVKPARMEENNRKLTWRDMSATDSKLIQNTRIGTMCPGAVDITPVTSSASTISSTSVSSADITSATTSTSALSLSKPLVKDEEHGEYVQKIKELTEEIIKTAELKQANMQKLVNAVNEVKKLEVELDRAGHNLRQVHQKYNDHETGVSDLRLRAKDIHEQLINAREADRRRNA